MNHTRRVMPHPSVPSADLRSHAPRVWVSVMLAFSMGAAAMQGQASSAGGMQSPGRAAEQAPGRPAGQTGAALTGGGSASSDTGAAAAPPSASVPSVVDTAHYVIGPDDMLQVTVWREPSLSGSLPVRPDGMISLVLIGDLKAAGRTPMELSSDISQRLKRYIQDPVVSVAVTADTSQRVFLVGQVGKVGPISLSPGMTPLQAISAGGGPGPYANVKHIYILRGTGDHQQRIPFNYKQALKGESRQSLVLLPGDTIIVP